MHIRSREERHTWGHWAARRSRGRPPWRPRSRARAVCECHARPPLSRPDRASRPSGPSRRRRASARAHTRPRSAARTRAHSQGRPLLCFSHNQWMSHCTQPSQPIPGDFIGYR